MLLLEAAFSILMFYIVMGFGVYLYCAVENYQVLGKWIFKMDRTHIGVIRYPKWVIGWMYKIGVLANVRKRSK